MAAVFEQALDKMHPGPLYCTAQERFAEFASPLPADLSKRIIDATKRFDTLPPEEKAALLQTFVSSQRWMDSATCAFSQRPVFRLDAEVDRERAGRVLSFVGNHLLVEGTLPKALLVELTSAVKDSMAPDHSRRNKLLAVGGAVVGAIGVGGFVASPTLPWAPAFVASYLLMRPFLHSRPHYPKLVEGYLKEQIEASFQVQNGMAGPAQMSLLTVFKHPSNPGAVSDSKPEIEGFLMARALRVLGWKQDEISQLFKESGSMSDPYSHLREAVREALGLHGRRLAASWTHALDTMGDPESASTVDFLDTMSLAHFIWAQRDRTKIAGEFADLVLASSEDVETKAA